jgi:hypothetical protein
MQMATRWLVLLTGLFLFIGQGLAQAIECTTCDKNLSACRTPAHDKYVSCMKGDNSKCGAKCTGDCKNDKEIQRCTQSCVKTCQGGTTCQASFTTASAQCTDSYRSCKKDCTTQR